MNNNDLLIKLKFRELTINDLSFNFMNIINYFTKDYIDYSNNSFDYFINNFDKIHNDYFKTYIITFNNIIIGTVKCIIEIKFHNYGKKVFHIEDLVIHKDYRNRGIGRYIINNTIDIAKNNNCYKIVLSCNQELSDFYLNNNFIKKGCEMSMYLK